MWLCSEGWCWCIINHLTRWWLTVALSKCFSSYEGQSFCKGVVKLSHFQMRHIYVFTKTVVTVKCIVSFPCLSSPLFSSPIFLFLLSSTHSFSNCNYHGLPLPNAADVSPLHTLNIFHSSLTLNDKHLAAWHGGKTALHYTVVMA